MTVLQGKEARGVDLGQLGRILGTVFAAGLIVAGAVFAMSGTEAVETIAPTQAAADARAQAMVDSYTSQHLSQLNELNKADIGVPSAGSEPFAPSLHTPGTAWSTFDSSLHVPGAAWSSAGSGSAVSGAAGVELADRIEGYPSSPTSPDTASEPTSRNFGTQTAK